jgi:hypothetical protein
MPDRATVYLPLSTWVHVRAITNAQFTQRVTIEEENGTRTVLTGSGERDTLMPSGDFGLTTPARSASSLGYRVTVRVESSSRGGVFQPSQVSQGACSVMYYNLSMVVSEDYVDQDWNDAVIEFSWWIPPAQRDPRDLHREQEEAYVTAPARP